MAKMLLTIEIETPGDMIGEKERIAAALEPFGKVRVLKVETARQMEMEGYKC